MTTAFDPQAVQAQPLDEAAVQRLKGLLREHALPAGGMSLEMVDGLLSALIVAPAKHAADEFLPLITAGKGWPSAAVEAEANALLARLWNHITARIAIDPEQGSGTFMPLLTFPANVPEDPAEFARAVSQFEFPLGAAWAGGFLHAVNLRLPEWSALEQQSAQISVGLGHMMRLIQLEPAADGSSPPPPDERVALMASVPYLLRAIAQHTQTAGG